MNKENVIRVRDAIKNSTIPDLGFNMSNFFSNSDEDKLGHGCGTTGCIAGWAVAVENLNRGISQLPTGELSHPETVVIEERAVKFLGISEEEGTRLFNAYSNGYSFAFDDVEPDHAVQVLDHLAETGEVDWSVVSMTPYT